MEAVAILLGTLLQAMALKQFILTATEPTENYLSSERTCNSEQYRINCSICQCLGRSQLICSIHSLTNNACAIHTMGPYTSPVADGSDSTKHNWYQCPRNMLIMVRQRSQLDTDRVRCKNWSRRESAGSPPLPKAGTND